MYHNKLWLENEIRILEDKLKSTMGQLKFIDQCLKSEIKKEKLKDKFRFRDTDHLAEWHGKGWVFTREPSARRRKKRNLTDDGTLSEEYFDALTHVIFVEYPDGFKAMVEVCESGRDYYTQLESYWGFKIIEEKSITVAYDLWNNPNRR